MADEAERVNPKERVNVHERDDLALLVGAVQSGDVDTVRRLFVDEWQRGFDYAVDTVGEWHHPECP